MDIFLKRSALLAFIFVSFQSFCQTLIINEVSQGPSGTSQEYIELLVVDTSASYNCAGTVPPSIDIRHWIVDDNSGYHGSSGVASGAIRFSNDPIWSAVPLGTTILLYNDQDQNPLITNGTINLSDGTCKIVAPISDAQLFESNTTTPGAIACSYPSSGWTSGGNWHRILLRNGGDCARIVDLNGCEVFSVCWGNVSQNTDIYFNGSASKKVYSFGNGDPHDQSNWTSGCTTPSSCGSQDQTPGSPNNTANSNFIAQFNNNCTPITPIQASINLITSPCANNGSISGSASGSIPGYTYSWYNSDFSSQLGTSQTLSSIGTGTYNLIATSSIGCQDTIAYTLNQLGGSNVFAGNDTTICAGQSINLTATGGGPYTWNNGAQNGNAITPSVGANTYIVTTGGISCTVSDTIVVTVAPAVSAAVNLIQKPFCIDNGVIYASGGNSYAWFNADFSSQLASTDTLSAIGEGVYNLVATSSMGCKDTLAYTLNTIDTNIVLTLSDTAICAAQTINLTGSASIDGGQFNWNNQGNTSSGTFSVNVTQSQNYPVSYSFGSCLVDSTISVSLGGGQISAGNDTTICADQSINLTATGGGPYIWNNGVQNGDAITPSVGINTYIVTAGGTSCPVSDTIVLTVAPAVSAAVNLIQKPFCIDNGAIYASGGNSYAWFNADFSSQLASTDTLSAIGEGVYNLVATSSMGCKDTLAYTLNTIDTNIVLTLSDTAICAAQTINLTGSASIAGGQFNWNNQGNTSSGTFSVNVTQSQNYPVSYSFGSCLVDSTISVQLNNNQVFAGNDTTICEGQSINLTATGGGPYTWNNGAQNGNAITPSVGTNTYIVTTGGISCPVSDTIVVTVAPAVSAAVNLIQKPFCIDNGAIYASGGNSYAWFNTDFSAQLASTDTLSAIGEGVYNLVATSSMGCKDTLAYTLNTIDTNIVLTLSDTAICAAQTINLTGSASIAGGQFNWNNQGNTSSGTFSVNVTQSQNYPVSYSFGSCLVDSTISVNLVSNISTDFSFNNACLGDSILFINQSTIASGATINSWQWNFGDGNTNSNENPKHLFANSGNFDVKLIAISQNGCSDSIQKTVIVYPNPTTDFTFNNICLGDSVEFVNQSTIASGATINSWQWNFGDGNTNFNENPKHLFTNFGNFDVKLVAISQNGCSDSIQKTITIYPKPSADFTFDDSCLGENVSFTDQSSTQNSIINGWNWNFGNGNFDNQQNTQQNFTQEGIYSVRLIVANDKGCLDSIVKQVSVFPNPVVNFSFENVCEGESINLNDQTSISNNFTSNSITDWQWDFGDGNTDNQQNTSHTYSTYGTYNIELIATSNHGCKDSTNLSASIHPKPKVNFTSPNPASCGKLCLDFENLTIIPSSKITSYSWNFGNGTTSNLKNPTNCFYNETFDPMKYTVSLEATSEFGCTSRLDSIQYVTIYPSPLANFKTVIDQDKISVFDPEIEFENQSIGANSYLWDFGDSTTSSEENPSHQFSGSTNPFNVCLKVSNVYGCESDTCQIIKIHDDYTIYVPNAFTPDNNNLNETFKPVGFNLALTDYELSIYNRWGELIFQTQEYNVGWDGTYKGKELPIGDYVWVITFKNRYSNEDIIKKGHFSLIR